MALAHSASSASPPSGGASVADLAVDTAQLEHVGVRVQALVGRLGLIASGGADVVGDHAAEAVGNDRLAFHVREFGRTSTLRQAGLVREAQRLDESIMLVAEVFAALERVTAMDARTATVTPHEA